MSTRTGAAGVINGVSTVAAAAAGTSTGAKATYTCPAGKQAKVSGWSVANVVAAATFQARATIGGTTVVLGSGTTAFAVTVPALLNAGDTADVNCSATAVGSAVDILIAAEEYNTI